MATRTPKEAGDTIVGATLAARAIVYFDGSAYNYLNTGAVIDKYLRINAGNNLEFGDLYLTNKIVNADINASAAISWSKMTVLTASRVPVLDGSGVIMASTTTATVLTYINTLTSDVQTQINALSLKSGGNGIEYKTTDFMVETENASIYIMNITSNNVDGELPDLSTVNVGDTRTFVKKYSAGAFVATVSVKAGTGDSIKNTNLSEVTSITIGGITGDSVTLVKRSSLLWELI